MSFQPIEAYQIFQAMRLHFTSDSYDFHKYHGKIKVDPSSFMSKNDKFFYFKLVKKIKQNEFVEFLLANFLVKDSIWINNLLDEDAEVTHKLYQKKMQSLSYIFEQDVAKLFDECRKRNLKLSDILLMRGGNDPDLLVMYRQKIICLETFIILDMILNFIELWNENMRDTLLWPKIYRLVKKYRPFMNIDLKKYKKILTLAIKNDI